MRLTNKGWCGPVFSLLEISLGFHWSRLYSHVNGSQMSVLFGSDSFPVFKFLHIPTATINCSNINLSPNYQSLIFFFFFFLRSAVENYARGVVGTLFTLPVMSCYHCLDLPLCIEMWKLLLIPRSSDTNTLVVM